MCVCVLFSFFLSLSIYFNVCYSKLCGSKGFGPFFFVSRNLEKNFFYFHFFYVTFSPPTNIQIFKKSFEAINNSKHLEISIIHLDIYVFLVTLFICILSYSLFYNVCFCIFVSQEKKKYTLPKKTT